MTTAALNANPPRNYSAEIRALKLAIGPHYIRHSDYLRDEMEFVSYARADTLCPGCGERATEMWLVIRESAFPQPPPRSGPMYASRQWLYAGPCGCALRLPVRYRVAANGTVINLQQHDPDQART